jgi:hypothetical protein
MRGGASLALFAEALVEEWLNRRGYFSIRGVKIGSSEIDLLAVSPGEPKGLHVEVSVAIRPMAYYCTSSPKRLSSQEVESCTERWVFKKYRNEKVVQQRETLWPGREWSFMFVHGNVKHKEELGFISGQGVELVEMREVLTELRKRTPFTTSSESSAVAELVDFYCS